MLLVSKISFSFFFCVCDEGKFQRTTTLVELGDGHFWMNESDIEISVPIKLVGDDKDPSNVIIEVNGTITWSSRLGCVEGVTFRRPRISVDAIHDKPILKLLSKCKLNLCQCIIDPNAIARDIITDNVHCMDSTMDLKQN